MNVRTLGRKALAVPAILVGFMSSAFAAVDASFTTAVTAVTGDVALYGAALVGVGAAGVGLGIALKYVKRIRSAA